jgi:hypothetical protein
VAARLGEANVALTDEVSYIQALSSSTILRYKMVPLLPQEKALFDRLFSPINKVTTSHLIGLW